MTQSESTCFTKFVDDPKHLRLYQQEGLTLDVTELICQVMKEQQITRKQLAKKLGKKKRLINQILNGEINIPLRTIADIFTILNKQLIVSLQNIQ